jgi:LCP family protein required for cell wall assembly
MRLHYDDRSMPFSWPSRREFGARCGIAFGVSAIAMVLMVIGADTFVNTQLNKIERINVSTAPAPPNGANYLVIGSDTRAFVQNEGEAEAFGNRETETGQRSDTMMVVHVEPNSQRTLVVSFPRDLWVDIPGQGMSKINAAFNIGPDKVIETLKANFGIEINHYLEVDFKSFQAIVHEIGSPPTYFPYATRDTKTNLKIGYPGCFRLDGPTSLAYVRSRDLEYYSHPEKRWVPVDQNAPDINRIKRQQSFIRGLAGLAVAKSLDNPLTAYDITRRVVPKLKADQSLENDEILDLVSTFRTINPEDQSALDMRTFPWVAGETQDGQSVLYPDDPRWRIYSAALADFSTKRPAEFRVAPEDVKLRVLDGTGGDQSARAALREFVDLGFERAGTGRDERERVQRTEVRYGKGAIAEGRLVLSYIDPQARLVADSTIKGADVVVVLGEDFEAVLRPNLPTTTTTPSAATPTTAAAASSATGPSTSNEAAGPIEEVDQDVLGPPEPRQPPC